MSLAEPTHRVSLIVCAWLGGGVAVAIQGPQAVPWLPMLSWDARAIVAMQWSDIGPYHNGLISDHTTMTCNIKS